MNRIARYSAVLGRSPFIARQSAGKGEIIACGFPPLRKSFWRSLFSEAHDSTVYLTAGMSEHPMAVPIPYQRAYPPRVELMAICDGQITGGPSSEDAIVPLLLSIAEYVIDTSICIGVGHTLDFQERLATNTQMSAFLFTPPEGLDEKRLCRCTKAQAVLNVMPITAPELEVIRNDGIGALIERFEAMNVRPVFDFTRRSVA